MRVVHASDLRHLSITGRYAYGLACVEALCAAWAVDDPFVIGEIAEHWQAAEINLACHWLDKHPLPRHVEDFATLLRPGGPPADRVQSLHHALCETQDIMARSCYAAASDTDSMQSVLNVVGILARWGVGLPRPEWFAHATWSGEFGVYGWGERFGRASFLGQARHAEPGAAADGGGMTAFPGS